MIKLIHSNKFDYCFDKIALVTLSTYLCLLVIHEASMISNIFILNIIVKSTIRLTFVMIILKDFYDFLRGKFNKNEIIIYIILGSIFSYSYLISKNAMPLLVLLYMIGFKNVDKDLFIKISFFSITIPLSLVMLTSPLPFIYDGTRNVIRYGATRTRYALGFGIPPMGANHLFSSVLMYILYKKHLKILDFICITLLNIIIFIFTDTKNAFISINLVLILYLAFNTKKNNISKKISFIITALSFPVCALTIFIFSYFYNPNNKIFITLNSILTGRLGLTHNGINTWGITLFGQKTYMSLSEANYNYIDSSYMNILFNNGIIILIIIIIMYMIYSYLAYINNDYVLLAVLLTNAIHGMIDIHLILICYSPFIILFSTMLFRTITKYKNKQKIKT